MNNKDIQPAPQPAVQRDWNRILLYAAIIVLAGLFVASPAFHGTWLWDDDQEITANGAIRDGFNGLKEIWKGNVGADYLPLKTTIIWIEWQIWQDDNYCYHVINAFFHVINALLVWKLFSQLRIRWAWIGGLLFAIHPILVESVAWVSEQKNTISLIFMLSSAICYINYDERRKLGSLVCALVLFLAALLSKSAVIMLPFCFLLYAWWRRGRISASDLVNTSAFFVITVIIAYVTIHFQHKNAIGTEIIPVGGLVSRTATAGMAIFFYLYKCVLPFNLIPIYPRWEVAQPQAWMFLPWPVMAGLLAWFWAKRKTWGRDMIFGLGFFVGNLVPVLGFVTMSYMRITWVADHFVYIPVIGVIGLVVAGAAKLYEKVPEKGRRWAMCAGVALLGYITFDANLYSDVFLNETNMWRYTLSQNPDAWQAHSRYGKVCLDSGRRDEAFYHIQQSNRLRPDLAETNNNMGVLLLQKNRGPEALPYFKEAVELMPIGAFLVNYSNSLTQANRGVEAAPLYERLLITESGPKGLAALNAKGYEALDKLYRQKGADTLGKLFNTQDPAWLKKIAAMKGGENVVTMLNTKGPQALEALYKMNKSEALHEWLKAIGIDPEANVPKMHGPDAYCALLKRMGVNPMDYMLPYAGNPVVLTNYGVALMQANRRDDAIRALQRALEINPSLADARRNLEIAQGKNQQAQPPLQQDLRFPISNVPGSAGQVLQIPSIFLNK